DLARQQAEPRDARRLLAPLVEELHPHADPEEGAAGRHELADGVGEPAALQAAHALAEVALAGEDEQVGGPGLVGVGREDRVGALVLERLHHRPDVARAVVQDDDPPTAHSTPLVDGICAARFGSRREAAPSARAAALKLASMMWCALAPRIRSRCKVIRASVANARQNSAASAASNSPMRPWSGG